jgi:hypothetical protein
MMAARAGIRRQVDEHARPPGAQPFLRLAAAVEHADQVEVLGVHVAVAVVAAPRRAVVIDERHRQMLDVDDQSEAEQQDHDHRNHERQTEIDRIAQQLTRLLDGNRRHPFKHGWPRPGR